MQRKDLRFKAKLVNDKTTLLEIKDAGFGHIDVRCSRCRRNVQIPFQMLHMDLATTTVGALKMHMKCEKCGAAPASVEAWEQTMAEGTGKRL